jgi:hypothetical protein
VERCLWETENVLITRNTIDFNPAAIMDCNRTARSACGVGGIFSEYGSPPDHAPGSIVSTRLTFFQNSVWSDNVCNGPSTFYAWNQGNAGNPVSWPAVSHQVALLQVRGIVVSGCVALHRRLPEAVVTWFVTDSADGIVAGTTRRTSMRIPVRLCRSVLCYNALHEPSAERSPE